MRKCIGDRQQQAISGRHCGCHSTRRNEARNHIRQSCDFRSRQDQNIPAHEELVDLLNSIPVAVGYCQKLNRTPFLDPIDGIHFGN